MSYDPVNKVVQQNNGRVIYSNGFGGISTIEPNNHRVADLEKLVEQFQEWIRNITIGDR